MRKTLTTLLIVLCTAAGAQVNLEYGTPQFSIPIHQYSDANNRLATSVSLVYTGGHGIKVNDVAGSVGTGWTLAAGGSITRIQNGEPDDQIQNNTFNYPQSVATSQLSQQEWSDYVYYRNEYFPKGYLTSEYSPGDFIDHGAGYSPLLETPGEYKPNPKFLADREQDVFVFSFGGRTGKFVIGKNGAGIRTLEDSKLSITPITSDLSSSGIRTEIAGFEILDESGIKYVFKDLLLSEVLVYDEKYKYSEVYPNGILSSPYGDYQCTESNGCRFVIKGRGYSTPKYVVGKWYLTEIINPLSKVKIKFNYQSYAVDFNNALQFKAESYGKIFFTLQKIKGIDKRLSSIELSPSEKVEFVYSPSNRLDLPFDKTLDEIKILYKGQTKFKWLLKYDYSVTHERKPASLVEASERFLARLNLHSIQKTGSDGDNGRSEPPYTFQYYIDAQNWVPRMGTIYHDHWGYNNRGHGRYHAIEFENIGTTVWGDEPWYILQNPSYYRGVHENGARGGLLKSIDYPSGGSLTYEYEQNRAVAAGQEVFTGGVRVKRTILFDGLDHQKDKHQDYLYKKENGLSSGWGHDESVYSYTISSTITKCENRKYVGERTVPLASSILASNIHSLAGWVVGVEDGSEVLGNMVTQMVVIAFVNMVIDFLTPDTETKESILRSSVPLNFHNFFPVRFSRIEVVDRSSSASLGKTVYELTSADEYPMEAPQVAFPFAQKQRIAEWQYGLPRVITTYNSTGDPVKRVEHRYNMQKAVLANSNYLSQTWKPVKLRYNCWFQSAPESQPYGAVASEQFYPLTGKAFLIETIEEDLTGAGAVVKATKYFYSATNNLVNRIETTNSRNELEETHYYYPFNYTVGGAIQQLDQNHIINVPIAEQTILTKANGEKYLLKGALSEYREVANGDIKPGTLYTAKLKAPVPLAEVAFSETQFNPNSNYYTWDQTIEYGSDGVPVQISSASEKKAQLYDYDQKLLVAEVTHAAISDVAYTSFESTGLGNWSLSGMPVNDRSTISGKKIYLLSSGSLRKSGLTANCVYLVTYWSNSGAYSVNGSAPRLLKSLGGWNLYEHRVPNPTNGEISISGSGYIDEVRLYPERAQMTSYTYDPLIGRTAEINSHHQFMYYDYDNFGRPVLIRDEQKNILKQFCYNYAGRVENCALFGNSTRSGSFTASCPDNYTSSAISYTIPANTFFAPTQQEAIARADAQLAIEGQENAQVLGTCTQNIIYARIVYTDWYHDIDYSTAMVSIKFYSDAACTLETSVTNLRVNYRSEKYHCNGTVLTSDLIQDCTGKEFNLGERMLIRDDGIHCYNMSYYVTPGAGYIAK